MIVYISMLLLTVIFAVLWQKSVVDSSSKYNFRFFCVDSSVLYMFLTFLPMWTVSSAMCLTGNDYGSYYSDFEKIIAYEKANSADFFMVVICRLISALKLDFQFLFVIHFTVSFIFLILCIKRYSLNYAMSYLLFFLIGYFFLLGINQIRQFSALMIIFYAFGYIRDKKLFKYILFVLIATGFHISAIVMLPFYFILRIDSIKNIAKVYAVIASIFLIMNFFYKQISIFLFSMLRPNYLDSYIFERRLGIDLLHIIQLLFVVFLIFKLGFECIDKLEPINKVFINSILFSAIILTLGTWIPEYTRFNFYFFVPMICLVPNLLEKEKNYFLKIFYIILFIGYSAFYLYRNANVWGVFPYQSIFSVYGGLL